LREIVLPDRTAKIGEHLANLLRAFGPKQRTMVFCVNMEHAAQVSKELQNRFADLGYSDYAVRIVSEEAEVKEIYERFRGSDKLTANLGARAHNTVGTGGMGTQMVETRFPTLNIIEFNRSYPHEYPRYDQI